MCDFPGQKELPLNDLPVLGDDNDSDDDEDEPTPRICATTADQNKLLYKAGISGSIVTAKDLYRALKIYGPFVPSIQGKTSLRPSRS